MSNGHDRASTAPADLIVVGSGVAGLAAALQAADMGARVLLATRGDIDAGSSWHAQGGIAVALDQDDSPSLHADDTMLVGGGLNSEEAVRILVNEGRGVALSLLKQGVPFERTAQGPELGLEAGHRRRRILHAGGGSTGAVLSDSLFHRVQSNPLITLRPATSVDELMVEDGRVVGIRTGEVALRAKATLLATGGYAGLWQRSTNPPGTRGSGLYLAWRAGATLTDLEFVQFHPTALSLPGAPAFLLSEALRGEGALVVDERGAPVAYPLLARDVLARAIFRHLREHGPVYLTMAHLDPKKVRAEFPAIAMVLQEYGLDLARDRIPIAPAAHYCMGGVLTDTEGRTHLPGLYVAGESACTGAQGANRLASNSLLECLVFGRRAAEAAIADKPGTAADFCAGDLPSFEATIPPGAPGAHVDDLAAKLDRYLGVERTGQELNDLLAQLPDPNAEEATPEEVVASLAARAALVREESRGAHYRADYPRTEARWQGHILQQRGQAPRFQGVPIC